MTYQVGDNVRITDGALESFLGIVEEIDTERQKVRVVVHVRPGDPGGTGPGSNRVHLTPRQSRGRGRSGLPLRPTTFS